MQAFYYLRSMTPQTVLSRDCRQADIDMMPPMVFTALLLDTILWPLGYWLYKRGKARQTSKEETEWTA